MTQSGETRQRSRREKAHLFIIAAVCVTTFHLKLGFVLEWARGPTGSAFKGVFFLVTLLNDRLSSGWRRRASTAAHTSNIPAGVINQERQQLGRAAAGLFGLLPDKLSAAVGSVCSHLAGPTPSKGRRASKEAFD